ncbi:MAG: MFS transporter [Magnetococcales bacterium]|nr:MFS transporter [Magnetococcales bacterium]
MNLAPSSQPPRPAPSGLTREVTGVMAALFLYAFANGLFGTLVALYAVALKLPHAISGVIIAAFSVGFLLGALLAPWWIARHGQRLVLALCAAGLALSAFPHPFLDSALVWIPIRVASGLFSAGIIVATDSWINLTTPNATRGRMVGLGLAIQWIATGGAQFLLLPDLTWKEGFWLVAALLLLTPATLVGARSPGAVAGSVTRPAVGFLWRTLPASLTAAFFNGLIVTAFLGMLPLWGVEMGLSRAELAVAIAGSLLLGGALQWPFARLSDRVSRRASLLFSLTLAVVSGAVLTGMAPGQAGLTTLTVLFAAATLQIYPVAVALANDHVTGERMVAVSSALTLANGLGMIVGPLLAGVVLGSLGPAGLVGVVTGLLLLLAGAYTLFDRASLQDGQSLSDRAKMVGVTPGAQFEEGDPMAARRS